jgi:hypothetical protein
MISYAWLEMAIPNRGTESRGWNQGTRAQEEVMAQQMQTRRNRQATPGRWQKAAQRAIAEGVQVFQIDATGQWIATSGSAAHTAYEVAVTGNIAHGCTCPAGMNGDPVCKHRARFFLLIGALSLDPEPEPPAPVLPAVVPFPAPDVEPIPLAA